MMFKHHNKGITIIQKTSSLKMIKYKVCICDEDYWEEIVVYNDEYYQYKTVLYFHCDGCGEDFRVEDFETGKEVFYNSENFTIQV